MNSKKILGVACWLASLLPMRYALLAAEHYSNQTGLVAFVGTMVLLLAGYVFFDGATSKAQAHQQGHH